MLCSSSRRVWGRTNPRAALSTQSQLLGCYIPSLSWTLTLSSFVPQLQSSCKENPFNRKPSPAASPSAKKPPKGSKPVRPPAPGHGFPLIKRKVKGPLGAGGAKASSVLSPRDRAVYVHPADRGVGVDGSRWLWLGRRMMSRLDPVDGSTMVSLCSRVRWGFRIHA